LVNDGKLGEAEQDIFKTRVVGHNNCPSKRDELLSDAGFESGFVIDESRWQFIVGKCAAAVLDGVRGLILKICIVVNE
jgi:hypothetical protein